MYAPTYHPFPIHQKENDNLKLHNNMNMNSIIARLTKQFHKTTTSRLPDSYNGRNSLFLFSKSEGIPNYYSVDMSTQENYGVENNDDEEYYGKFRKIRASLDFEYHGEYSRCRKKTQIDWFFHMYVLLLFVVRHILCSYPTLISCMSSPSLSLLKITRKLHSKSTRISR